MPVKNCFNWICFRFSSVKHRSAFSVWYGGRSSVLQFLHVCLALNLISGDIPETFFSRLLHLKCTFKWSEQKLFWLHRCAVLLCGVIFVSSKENKKKKQKSVSMAIYERASVCVCVWQRERSVHVIPIVRIKWLLCLTIGREFYKGNTLQREQRPHCVTAACGTLSALKQATISY